MRLDYNGTIGPAEAAQTEAVAEVVRLRPGFVPV
jgi:hypothetical protein